MIRSKNQHGIHSPFLFQLYNNVLNSEDQFYCFSEIEKIRYQFLKEEKCFDAIDFGAGSKSIRGSKKKVSEVAKTSLANSVTGQRYFKLVNYLKPTSVLELGTCLGISTAYLAKGNPLAKIYTFEGNSFLNKYAKDVFKQLNLKNIFQIEGDIGETLQPFLLEKDEKIDFVIIDANHKSPFLFSYLKTIKPFLAEDAFIIIDDISWSDDMRLAWEVIRKQKDYTLTFENMNQGFLCTSKNYTKQHFYLRF